MDLRNVPSAELVAIGRLLAGCDQLCTAWPLLQPFPLQFAEVSDALNAAESYYAAPPAQARAPWLAEIALQDKRHDTAVRVPFHGLRAYELAFPGRAELRETRELLYPAGLSVVNGTYANEAGEADRVRQALEASPRARQVLESYALGGIPLQHWIDEWLAAGRAIAELLAGEPAEPKPPTRPSAVRRRFLALVRALLVALDLSPVSPSERARLLEPLLGAARRHPATRRPGPVPPV